MPDAGTHYVYILTNASHMLYIGVTDDLVDRVRQHKRKLVAGFTQKHNITQLIYFEKHPDVVAAITRERELKRWPRGKQVALIRTMNPTWRDLSAGWHSR